MFFSPYKNSYLQLNGAASGINPRLLNRAVNEAMGWETDCRDKELPLNRLTSDQPCLPTTYNDFLCRAHAFGTWALPKLLRELHSECPQTVSNAIDTIMEKIHDPEKTIEAVGLKIVQRVADLMLNNDASIRERICIILTTLANQQIGREAICKSAIVLKNILVLFKDKIEVVRYRAAMLAYSLSENFKACFTLIDFDYIAVIHQRILIEECLVRVPLLKTMHNLMHGEGKNIAYANGVFSTMVKLLNLTLAEILEETLNCIMILLTLKCAKKEAVEIELLPLLYKFLNDTRLEIYTSAAGAIMNATHRTKSKKQSGEIDGLLERLVSLTYDVHNPRAQMWSIKALTNLTEYPPNRQILLKHHLKTLEKIPINPSFHMSCENIQIYQKTLLNVITWKP